MSNVFRQAEETRMRGMRVLVYTAVFFLMLSSSAHAAPTSENYSIDALIIGPETADTSTSTNYTFEYGVGDLYEYDDSTSSGGSQGGGGGRSSSIINFTPPETGTSTGNVVTTLNTPLVLNEGQAGVYTQEFLPENTVIVGIPPQAPLGETTDIYPIRFVITKRVVNDEQLPVGFSKQDIIDNSIFNVRGFDVNGNEITELQRLVTLTIITNNNLLESPQDSLYHFDTELNVWVRMNVGLSGNTATFQTFVLGDFMLVSLSENVVNIPITKEEPKILPTPRTTEDDVDVIKEKVERKEKERKDRQFVPIVASTTDQQESEVQYVESWLVWLVDATVAFFMRLWWIPLILVLLGLLLILWLIFSRDDEDDENYY